MDSPSSVSAEHALATNVSSTPLVARTLMLSSVQHLDAMDSPSSVSAEHALATNVSSTPLVARTLMLSSVICTTYRCYEQDSPSSVSAEHALATNVSSTPLVARTLMLSSVICTTYRPVVKYLFYNTIITSIVSNELTFFHNL